MKTTNQHREEKSKSTDHHQAMHYKLTWYRPRINPIGNKHSHAPIMAPGDSKQRIAFLSKYSVATWRNMNIERALQR